MQTLEIIFLIVGVFVGVLLLLGVALLLAMRYVYRRAFYSPEPHPEVHDYFKEGKYTDEQKADVLSLIEELLSHPYEEVYIKSHDGLTLFARYYHIKDGAPVDIQCHGYRGTSIRDFCGGARLSRTLSHNILLIDERASGKSEGDTVTFGILERYDVLAWANYITERFGMQTKIYLYGISMGASTVIMTRTLPLPENVVGIFADCPFDTPYNIIEKVIGSLGYPTKYVMPIVCLGARIFGKFNLREYDCIRAMREESKIPVYLVHGAADGFVPAYMSENIHNANPEKSRLLLVDGADHGMSFMTAPDQYKEHIRAFLEECEGNCQA